MSRLITTALLAQTALAAFNFPEHMNLQIPKTNRLAEIVMAPTTTNAAIVACSTAEAVLSTCLAQGAFDNLRDPAAASCICCGGGAQMISEYGKCASYIASSATQYSSELSVQSLASSYCKVEGDICSATASGAPTTVTTASESGSAKATATGTGASSATNSPTRTRASGGSNDNEAACTSFTSVLLSCVSATPGFTTLKDAQAQSCVCYRGGKFTTTFDDFASSCANYAKTSSTRSFSDLSVLATFCEDYASGSASKTASGTGTSSVQPKVTGGFGGIGGDSTTTGGGSGPQTVTVTPTSSVRSSTNAAAPAAMSGPLGSLVNAITFVLSFFVLI